MADSFIFLCLSGLYGFVFFTIENKLIDPSKEIKDEIRDIKTQLGGAAIAKSQNKPQFNVKF